MAVLPDTDPHPRTRYRDVLEIGEFRVLLAMMLLRALATTAEILGLSVLVYATTGSATLSAVAYGIGFAPQLIGGAFLTALADRLPARPLIVGLALVRAVPGVLIGTVHMPVAAMLVLMGVVGCFDPVASAATGGTTRTLLDGDRYVLGRSMLNLVMSSAQIIGLGVGGVMLAVLSPRELLLVSAAALVIGAGVARVGLRSRPATSSERRAGAVRHTMTGNRRMLTDRTVRGLLLAQWLPAWFVTGAESLIVSYVGHSGRPAATAGVLLVAVPVGMLAGDLVVGRLLRPSARERASLPLAVAMGVPLIGFAVALPTSVGFALLLLVGAGFGFELGLQRRFAEALPDHAQAQGFGLLSTGLMGGQGLAPIAAGGLAAALGSGVTIAVAGAATVVCMTLLRAALAGP